MIVVRCCAVARHGNGRNAMSQNVKLTDESARSHAVLIAGLPTAKAREEAIYSIISMYLSLCERVTASMAASEKEIQGAAQGLIQRLEELQKKL